MYFESLLSILDQMPSVEIMKINIMHFAKKYLVGCTAIALAFSTIGCESLTTDSGASKKKKKDSSWFSFKKKEYQVPQSMTVTWSHDILTLPGKAATRGFGGRFYFYNEKSQSIPVDGDLVVYGFDDTNKLQTTEDLSQATKRFRFTAEQFTTHFSEGELGASYSVWIPWDEAYGAPKKIMLIPTFLTKEGKMVRGTAANLNLPGTSTSDPNAAAIQQASATAPTLPQGSMRNPGKSDPSHDSGFRTTTFQVPSSSLTRHSIPKELPKEMPPAMTEFQSQQLAAASSIMAAQYGANGNGQTSATMGNPTPVELQPQSAPARMSLSPSTPTPVSQTGMTTKTVNGWVLPEYAPMNYSGLSPRSVPNQFPAPTSQGVQPASYPTR